MNTSMHLSFFAWLLLSFEVLLSCALSSDLVLVAKRNRANTEVSQGFEVLLQRANEEMQLSSASADSAMSRDTEASGRLGLASSIGTLAKLGAGSALSVVALVFLALLVAIIISLGLYDHRYGLGRSKEDPHHAAQSAHARAAGSSGSGHAKHQAVDYRVAAPLAERVHQKKNSGFKASMYRSLAGDQDILCNALVVQGAGVKLSMTGSYPLTHEAQHAQFEISKYGVHDSMIARVTVAESARDPCILIESALKFPIALIKTKDALVREHQYHSGERQVEILREELVHGRHSLVPFAIVKKDAATLVIHRLEHIDNDYQPADILQMARPRGYQAVIFDAHNRLVAEADISDPCHMVISVQPDSDVGLALCSLIAMFKLG